MKTTVVIPTYWGRPAGEPFNPSDVVYDHPTPLDQDGTLSRTLESLTTLDPNRFDVVIIVGPTHPELAQSATDKVTEILKTFRPRLDLWLLTPAGVKDLRVVVTREIGPEIGALIDGYGYSNIRNLCLIAAHLRWADVAVLLDDDEVVEFPEWLDRAVEFMDSDSGKKRIKTKAGWYKRPDGSYKGPPTRDAWWMKWRGAEAMNEGFDAVIGRPGRFGPTPFAFGGNMVIDRDIFSTVAFDPHLPRGEDIDYVFNTMAAGHEFIMDRELWIRHLPPPSLVPAWLGFRQNALRFTYARLKLASQKPTDVTRIVSLDELMPYPGLFLGDDLDEKIRQTCTLLGQKYVDKQDSVGYKESMFTIEMVEDLKRREPNPFSRHLEFQIGWQSLMRWTSDSRFQLSGVIQAV